MNTPVVLLMTFLTKYGLTHPGVGSEVTGSFTLFFFGASAAGSLAGGFLSDRQGVMFPMRLLPLFSIGAVVAATLSSSPSFVCAAFALVGLAFGTRVTCLLPAVFRFAGPQQRPSYMAVSFTCIGLFNAVLPPLVGALIDVEVLSFPMMFAATGGLSLASFFIFFKVPAPTAATPRPREHRDSNQQC